MKKFKQILYAICTLFFCVGGFLAYFHEDIVLRWDWDFIDTWVGLLRFVLQLGAVGLVLFFLELVVQNIHIGSLKSKVKTLENEVLTLKGKLYDRAAEEENEQERGNESDDENENSDE